MTTSCASTYGSKSVATFLAGDEVQIAVLIEFRQLDSPLGTEGNSVLR